MTKHPQLLDQNHEVTGPKGPNQRIEDQFFSADFDNYWFLPSNFKVLNTSKLGGPNGLKVGALLGRTPLL